MAFRVRSSNRRLRRAWPPRSPPQQATLETLAERAEVGPIVVAAGIQDPGNLGTILRSAEALGAQEFFGEGTVSEWNPKVVRASAGSLFRLPAVRAKLAESILALRGTQCRLLATSSHEGTPISQAKLTGPVAIFVGNEGAGIPRDTLQQMDQIVVIPPGTRRRVSERGSCN